MKTNFFLSVCLLVLLFVFPGFSVAQTIVDTVRNQPVEVIPNQQQIQVNTTSVPVQNVPNDGKFYHWETPVFDIVDLGGLERYKSDNQAYLSEIEVLDGVLKRNKQELKSFQNQAKDLAKALSIEQKNLNEKKKFYKEDEKLLKREKSLRDREAKLIQKERKQLRKNSEGLSNWQIEDRLAKFNEREDRIQYAEERWESKREILQQNIAKLSDVQVGLNDRDFEIKERMRELGNYEREQNLKQKQLDLEKKQVKLEIKKAKAAIKEKEGKKSWLPF